MKKILALLLVAMLSVGMIAGCGSSKPEEEAPATTDQEKPDEKPAEKPEDKPEDKPEPVAEGPKVLKLVEASDIPTLNSSVSTDATSFMTLVNVVEGLYTIDENHVPVPGVATGYDVSEDGLTYTFHLRQDSVWSNGDPVTANDFVYAFRKLADPATASQYQGMVKFAGLLNHEAVMAGDMAPEELGVSASDDYTFVLELEFPVPYFLSLMTFPSFYPLNQGFVEAQGDAYGTTDEATIYNGPYVLEDWEKEYGWSYVKNDTYWDKDNVDIDRVDFRVVKEYNTRLNMYLNGEIERVGLRGEDVEKYKNDPNFFTEPDSALFYLELNQDNKLLANTNARKAMALVVDKSYIENVILNNGSMAADYFVPSGLAQSPIDGADFREDGFEYNEYDLETGQEYWAKAKEELGIDTFEIELLGTDTDTTKKIMEYLVSQFEDNLEGLTVTINQQPWENKLELVRNGEFEFVFSGWGPDYSDPMTFLELFHSESGYNRSNYSSPEFDALIEASLSGDLTTDLEARWEALLEAERILLEDDAAVLPLFQRGAARMSQPYIKGMNYHLIGGDYTFKFVTIEK